MDRAEQLMAVLGITLGLPIGKDEERSDFRAVPRSDSDPRYRDRGLLGSYATNDGKPFEAPADVRFFAGFGADEEDLERGWCEPRITNEPAYVLENYQERSSEPLLHDVYNDNADAVESDYEFRNRNRRSRGFLTRPRLPINRG